MATSHCWLTLLLWQIWSSAQDQVAVIKRSLGLLLPGIVVFLDVDDLEEIDLLEQYVQASQCMLLMASKGYYEFVPGMLFDTSLQEDPTMKEGYFGLEMNGMFSPVGGPELRPEDVELNSTAVDSPLPVHDQAKDDRKKFEIFLH